MVSREENERHHIPLVKGVIRSIMGNAWLVNMVAICLEKLVRRGEISR